jgi:hypothetical protein
MGISSGNADKGKIGLKYEIELLHEHDDMYLKLREERSDLPEEPVRCRYANSPTARLGRHRTV